MDFGNLEHEPTIDEFLHDPNFPVNFESLELDSLLFGNDESQESSSSSNFGFNDQNAGFRSRDGGSLGDSSSDSSPPLSCTNFTESDQEMWDFGFKNPSPFANKIDPHFGVPFHEEEVIADNDDYIGHYADEDQLAIDNLPLDNSPMERFELEQGPLELVPPRQKQVITIVQQPRTPVRRVIARPINKVYRVREHKPMTQEKYTYRVITQQKGQIIQNTQLVATRPIKQELYDFPPHCYKQPQSGPLIKHEPEEQRYVAIAPTREIKVEETRYTSEQHRKIRNRMYAQASRNRRKEYEEALKVNLQEALHDNEHLRSENEALKQRLAYYEPAEFKPSPRRIMHNQKKMIAAGTALMMFGLFAIISPFSMENHAHANSQILAIPNESSVVFRHSRVLTYEDKLPAIKETPEPPVHAYSNSTQNDCEMYKLNATEAMRVNNDIERWVQVHSFDNVPIKFSGGLLNKEAMKKFNEARKEKTSAAFGPKKQVVQKKSEQAALRSRERTWRQLDLLKTGTNIKSDSEKIQKKRQDIDKIASIVRQNRDTLYIMTLQDYVLLPSLMKGSNSIPKLSLLLPSVPMNGTLLDQYTLLRVDCEVTGTGQLTLSNKQLSYLMP